MCTGRTWAVALGLLAGGAAAVAQQVPQAIAPDSAYLAKLPPLIDRQLFFADPEQTNAQVSPDGKWISFLQENRGRMNVWIKGLDAPLSAARPITADTLRPVRSYFWSRDSKYVLYVQDKGGDENYHLYAVEPSAADSGVPPARDLTPYGAIQAQVVAVPRKTPGKILVAMNDRDPATHDLYRVDLASGARELVRRNEEKILAWYADQNGELRLLQRMRDDGTSELLVVDGEYLAPFMRLCSPDRGCGVVDLTADGTAAYVVNNPVDSDRTQLYRVFLRGHMEQLVARDPLKRSDVAGVLFSEARNELDAVYFDSDRRRTYPLSETFQQDERAFRAHVSGGGDLHFRSTSADERYHIVTITSDVEPGTTYLYDRGRNRVTLLFRSRPGLPVGDLAHVRPLRYPARDGVRIPAYLALPKGVASKGLPVVILPHGGPTARDFWAYNGTVQFLVNRGYAVFQPNFRGSTGFGTAFVDAGNKEWGTGVMQNDITDGARWLVGEGIADPKRIAIMGASYGGYATLAGLAFTPDLYAAGVDLFGPSNLVTLLKATPPYWTVLRQILDTRLGNPDSAADLPRLRAQSPLFAARQIRAPLLVFQGANDVRVKRVESEQIVLALRDLGRPVEYLLAPDEGHGLTIWQNRMAVMAAVEAFLAPRLGGRVQETMEPEIRQTLERLRVDLKTLPAAAPAGEPASAP